MRFLITSILVIALVAPTLAAKPHHQTPPVGDRVPCGLNTVIHDWDFTVSDHGFATGACDDQGAPVWEWGATSYIPDAPGTVWGTVLEGDYATDAGESLLAPSFTVDASTVLLEIVHYYDAEALWDGGNVTVNGDVVYPLVGYPGLISVPGDWMSWCVDNESGFTGLESGWLTSCFDLSAYLGQEVTIALDFGSDDMFTEAGWYVAAVRVGTDEAVAAEAHTFGALKALFR